MSALHALGRYRDLPRLLGSPFLLVGFLARLPVAMVVLGVLTLVTSATGSVGEAGLASAALAVSTAVAGPLIGRWTDRRGQRLPLLLLAPVNAVALVVLVLAARAGAPVAALCALCAVVGLSNVPIGSLARVRWLGAAGEPRVAGAALSYESMADELGFVLGPALVGLAASAGSPEAPLLLAAALVAIFVTAFALHPSAAVADPRVRPLTAAAAPGLARVLRKVGPAVAGMACVGLFFGASQTAVTAFAVDAGEPGRAGLIYALMGTGSAVMALAVVALPESVTLRARLVVCGLGMAALSTAMTAPTGLGPLAVLVLAVGLFVGPAMVTLFTAAGRLAPEGGTAVAMTALSSANVVGVALAAAVGGRLADAVGPDAAFAVAAAASAALALLALALRTPVRHIPAADA
ncbi:MFS transporter [Georgenia thermotolerans]|uniref:MFS transporter n=1 Tax=Georgenia thermotolerans TaxID=527326 RepID=A0A7J5USI1_9MICO|nr:MFS transporter [Georgenia thermotolerans]KAE8765114.1 MFS transporter [Georgenia thermotolerans]